MSIASVYCDPPSQEESAPDVRYIPKDQAKREIIALLADGVRRDAFDIAIELDLDLDFSHEVCDELQSEGLLRAVPKVWDDVP